MLEIFFAQTVESPEPDFFSPRGLALFVKEVGTPTAVIIFGIWAVYYFRAPISAFIYTVRDSIKVNTEVNVSNKQSFETLAGQAKSSSELHDRSFVFLQSLRDQGNKNHDTIRVEIAEVLNFLKRLIISDPKRYTMLPDIENAESKERSITGKT